MEFCPTHPQQRVDAFMGCTVCHYEAQQLEDAARNEDKCARINETMKDLERATIALDNLVLGLRNEGAPESIGEDLNRAKAELLGARRRLSTWRALIQSQVKR